MRTRAGAVSLAVATSLLMAGAVATALAAAAVGGHSKCTRDANFNGKVDARNVNLHKGPGTSYRSYGQLTRGARVYIDCTRQPDITKQPWLHLKVNSGAHTGQRGWVRDDLIYWPLL